MCVDAYPQNAEPRDEGDSAFATWAEKHHVEQTWEEVLESRHFYSLYGGNLNLCDPKCKRQEFPQPGENVHVSNDRLTFNTIEGFQPRRVRRLVQGQRDKLIFLLSQTHRTRGVTLKNIS